MNEQAREAVNALQMLVDCKENPKPCGHCTQFYFAGKIACHPITHFYGAVADLIENMATALEQVKRERDAAVRELKDSVDACEYCIKWEGHDMCDKWQECSECCGFEWRGPCEENGGVEGATVTTTGQI